MLKLDKLQIAGFKSFSDRTEVTFPAGVTAVVGPNGCGKSNIGDALNWVLGEQSPKMLRGRQMADVIFSGSRGRKPLGMAEVSLSFSGAEGISTSDQGRLMITRRLFRSGESEYLINGARVRLMDIHKLVRDARVGARTYATIEQGKIEQVLNAKPRDRRLIIEDAAGIAGYKQKRRLTEVKLDATQFNLLRVNDIVSEVQRQINSLKRQAARARRYRRLREELRTKEQVQFALRASELDQRLTGMRTVEAGARDAEAAGAAGLGRLEADLEEQRCGLDRANQAHREASERLHQLEIEIDRTEGQIRTCKERIADSRATSERQRSEAGQLEERVRESEALVARQRERVCDARARVERLAGELAESRETLERAECALREQRAAAERLRGEQFEALRRATELRNRLLGASDASEQAGRQQAKLAAEEETNREICDGLERDTSSIAGALSEHAAGLKELEARFEQSQDELVAARERGLRDADELTEARRREESATSRLNTLEDVATRFAGHSDGVRTLLTQGESVGLRTHGVVADFVEAGTDVESAAEGYLGWLLPAVILEDDIDVTRAADLLRREGSGRTSFICRTQPTGCRAVGSPQNGSREFPDDLLKDSRVLGCGCRPRGLARPSPARRCRRRPPRRRAPRRRRPARPRPRPARRAKG